MPTPMLDSALDYARRGVPVFPCKPDKTPHTFNGVKDASTSAVKIRQWWTQAPQAMIGMAMGKAAGIWALDPDARKGDGPDGGASWLRLKSENGGCPATHTHNTPGGGQHVLFAWDPDRPMTNRTGGLKGLGIDVRGEGGYIIAPPSVNVDGRAYEVNEPLDFWKFAQAPDWLYDLISPSQGATPGLEVLRAAPSLVPADDPLSISAQALANVARPQVGAGDERAYSASALNRQCDALAAERAGGRNEALNIAAMKMGQLVGPGRLSETEVRNRLFAAASANGLVADGRAKVIATIDSGLSKGLQEPRVIPDRQGRDAAKTESVVAPASPVAIVATPYVWKPAASIPRREWLYGNHLIRRFASATIAPGGVGKSSLVLTEAIAMATGRDLLGIKPRQRCRVWYWNGEDPVDEIDRRIAAICIKYGVKSEGLEGWLFTDSGRDQEIVIATQARDGAAVAEPVAAGRHHATRSLLRLPQPPDPSRPRFGWRGVAAIPPIRKIETMALLKNSRHEAFAHGLARGKVCGVAYVEAGYVDNYKNANRLKSHEDIVARVAELSILIENMRAVTTHKIMLTREWILEQLIDNVFLAKAQEKPDLAGANKALHLLGLELSMYIERKEIGQPGQFDGLTIAGKRERVLEIAKQLGLGHISVEDGRHRFGNLLTGSKPAQSPNDVERE